MPDQSLSRAKPQTLRKGWEFDLVFRTGLRIQGELVRLLLLRNAEPIVRVGYVVGRRQGKAHVRSRGRRVLREAFRGLPVVPGVTLVLSLKDRALGAKSTQVRRDLAALLKRQGLLLSEKQEGGQAPGFVRGQVPGFICRKEDRKEELKADVG